jgi:hypothetical protein
MLLSTQVRWFADMRVPLGAARHGYENLCNLSDGPNDTVRLACGRIAAAPAPEPMAAATLQQDVPP